jgi:hypothetical protein
MTVSALKQLLAGATGGTFSITAGQIGVDAVTSLFTTYLPSSTLTLASATGDAAALSVTGQLTLGDAAGMAATAVFSADSTNTNVTGVTITATLPGWTLKSPPALVFAVTSVGQYLKTPQLVLQAGGNDPDTADPSATLGGVLTVKAGDGTSQQYPATAPVPPPDPNVSANLVFYVAPNVSLDNLNALTQFVTGMDFDVIPSTIPVATTLTLAWMQITVDPVHDALLSLTIDLTSAAGLTIVADVFEIPSFTFSFVVPFPGSGQPVSATAGATMNIYGEIVNVSVLLPSPLYVQGSLGNDTPVPLKPFVSHFLSSNNIPDDFEISALSFGIDLLAPHEWAFELGLSNLWNIPLWGTTTLDLQRLLVTMQSAGTGTTPSLFISLRYAIGGTDLYLTAQEQDTAWTFSGGTVGYQTISFIPLLQDLTKGFGLDATTLPDSLTELALHSVQLTFSTVGGADEFTFALNGELAVSNVTVTANLTADIKASTGANPFAATFGGTITLVTSSANIVFNVKVQRVGATTLIIGTLDSETTPLQLQDLLSSLGFNPQIPSGIDIALTDLGILYQAQTTSTGTTSTFIVTAASKTYGKALFIMQRVSAPTPATTYVFAADPKLQGSLSQVPLIGKDIPQSLNLSLSDLQVLFASKVLTAADVTALNTLLTDLAAYMPGDQWQLPVAGIPTPLELNFVLAVGNTTIPFAFNLGGGGSSSARMLADGAPQESAGSAHWLSIQKSLGPLYFNRVGFGYAGGDVSFLLDASLTFSALAVSLDGLSVTSPITSFSPTFGLQGMGVNLNASAVQITGAFLSTTPNGLNDDTWEYAGEIVVSAEAFTISGIGAYGKFKGNPSIFLFVMLDAPLGGPSFFFVTGIAGGFGYNRSIDIPPIGQLPSFPLVAAAMSGETGNNPFAGKGNDPGAALQVMDKYLPMSVGENWVAAGIRFTSFELLQSFALLTVAFGTRFEVALLGLSAIAVPPLEPVPVAYAELAIEVTFSPDDGVLAVAAQLTPASFVLDKACHLTGGFAFYMWFKNQPNGGASAGDFVVTLGGYNPNFNKPSFYPTVPILGANWQVVPELAIKGGIYFALTPSCVMAGGYLNATWQSGDLKAWFDASADFLLSWKPFHYQADISVSLGASYRLNLGFASHTFTVHVGAELAFWGPTFAGYARIDLDIITITISFGGDNPQVKPIDWSEFKQSFLPATSSPSADARTAGRTSSAIGAGAPPPTPTPSDTYCTSQVTAGLLVDLTGRKLYASDPDWVISPELFQITTNAVVPSTQAVLVTATSKQTPIGGTIPATFGVGPVGVADGDLSSTHTITITKVGNAAYDAQPNMSVTPVTASVPRAPWSKAMSLDLVRSPNIGAVNSTTSTIPGLVTGFVLQPSVTPSDSTPIPFNISDLQLSTDPTQPQFSWASPTIPTNDTFDQTQAFSSFQSSLTGADAARTGILKFLAAQGVPVNTTVDVTDLAASADQVLLHAPLLSYLGEEPTAS